MTSVSVISEELKKANGRRLSNVSNEGSMASDCSIHGEEKIANTMWSILIVAIDSFCMLLYFLMLCGIVTWLLSLLYRYDEQYEKFYGQICQGAELYECKMGPCLKNNLAIRSGREKEILFCEQKEAGILGLGAPTDNRPMPVRSDFSSERGL